MLKIKLSFAIFFMLSLMLTAQEPDGYYSTAEGLIDSTLKSQLHEIIKDHHPRSYDNLWTDFQKTDKKPNGKVWDMYSDNPDGDPPYEFTFIDDQCSSGGSSGEGECYNREHSMPQSWFDSKSPMQTDLFHLYPVDSYMNTRRSNAPYGETDNPDWTSQNGSKKGPCSYPGYSGTIFEPIDEYKGDFARTYFYMVTRYENVVSGWPGNSPEADAVLNGTKFPAFEDWALDMLIEWHNNDPVSDKEIARNDSVYAIQSNRNPFIDHQEYVNYIWGDFNGNTPPNIRNIETIYSLEKPDSVDIKASITDMTGTVVSVELKWGANPEELNNTISMEDNENDYISASSIPVKENDTRTYFQISATDDSSETNTTPVLNIDPYDIISENFTDCPPEDWIIKDLASNEDWSCTDGYMEVNAYGSDEAADDWLITPSFNPNEYEEKILTFETWTHYADEYYPALVVKYSTDFNENESPVSATWDTLSCKLPGEYTQTWTYSGEIDLSDIDGDKIHIAFHYTSSGTGGSTSSWWKVDNVKITGYPIKSDTSEQTSTFDKIYDKGEPKIYPNPSSGMLSVEFKQPTEVKGIDIYSINGNLIQKKQYTGNYKQELLLNLRAVSRGTYILKIHTKTDIYYKKVLLK